MLYYNYNGNNITDYYISKDHNDQNNKNHNSKSNSNEEVITAAQNRELATRQKRVHIEKQSQRAWPNINIQPAEKLKKFSTRNNNNNDDDALGS